MFGYLCHPSNAAFCGHWLALMIKKAIFALLCLTFFFSVGGLYIFEINYRIINNLEIIFSVHQMEFLRDNLRKEINIIQADLYLSHSLHRTNIDDFVAHGEALDFLGASCFKCHHGESTMYKLVRLKQGIHEYLENASRVYSLSVYADREQREMAEESAIGTGLQLSKDIDALVSMSSETVSLKASQARQDIARMKNILLGLLIALPLLVLVLAFIFIKRFARSFAVLIQTTEIVKAGELDYIIAEKLPDEFNVLATAFNHMTISLKKQREMFAAEHNRYRVLFESASDAIFIMEGEGEAAGRIIAANQAAAIMHGYTVDELRTLYIQDLDTRESAAHVPARIQQILAGGRLEAMLEHRKKDGTVFPVEVRAGLLESEGRKYILAFDRDVTMRNRTETALQRSRQLAVVGQMAAGLAHEIKNPLAGIKVSMEVLMNELVLAPADKMIFTQIVGEVQRIESLLKNLLNYARTPRPVFSLLALNQQIENTIKNLSMLLKSPEYGAVQRKGLEFVCNLDPALPLIKADASQMQQIVLNLLLNALDASSAGATITVSTRLGHNGSVELIVADRGKGLSEEACAKVFQPFYTTKPKGIGLGLAITKRLVEQHNGEIAIVSVLDQGTVFTVTLPIEQKSKDENLC